MTAAERACCRARSSRTGIPGRARCREGIPGLPEWWTCDFLRVGSRAWSDRWRWWTGSLRTSRLRMDVALHLARPLEKAPQVVPLAPHEFPELQKSDLRHLHASVCFDAPKKVGASPWGQAMAPGGVPQEAKLVAHTETIITTKGTKVHVGKQRCSRWTAAAAAAPESLLCPMLES